MTAQRRHITLALCCAAAIALRAACGLAADDGTRAPERRAIAFLAAEVSKWESEHNCFSCHNNGDAARGLIWARASGALDDLKPLDGTLRFLGTPQDWDANGPNGPFKDKKLARIQFGAALAEAIGTGLLEDRDALDRGAALVAELQSPAGSWETDAPGTIGSPVTYGRTLATAMAQQMLRLTGNHAYHDAIARAQHWFERTETKSVLDAAATLLGLASNPSDEADARRRQCLKVIRAGRSSDGGWGPFVNSQPESFDTALVVIALVGVRGGVHVDKAERTNLEDLIVGGRKHLLAAQEPDGGWPPTTRPPGVDSYAQRLSTTGWVTQALLATRPRE